jgi:hypothetical protein
VGPVRSFWFGFLRGIDGRDSPRTWRVHAARAWGPRRVGGQPHSGAPGLMSALKESLGEDLGEVPSREPALPKEDLALYEVSTAIEQMEGPVQTVEFLARKLLVGRRHGVQEQILLGSPIYAALRG